MQRNLGIIVSFLLFNCNFSLSQEYNKKIVEDEVIKLLVEYEGLLNTLSDKSLSDYERGLIMRNSYTENANQIFRDDKVIIESNLDPRFTSEVIKDMSISQYLKDFDLFYEKSITPHTIHFTNISLDTIYNKEQNSLAEVSFESIFKGKHLYRSGEYSLHKRKATMQVNHTDTAWNVKIIQVTFNKNDLLVAQTYQRKVDGFSIDLPLHNSNTYHIYCNDSLVYSTNDSLVHFSIVKSKKVQKKEDIKTENIIPNPDKKVNEKLGKEVVAVSLTITLGLLIALLIN